MWTRFHKMNLHQRINKANLITQLFKTNSSKLHFKSFKISREQYRKIVNAIPKPFAIFIIFFHDEISKKLIGKKKIIRGDGKNQRNRRGRKELTPRQKSRFESQFLFLFFIFKGTRARSWNWVDLDWIQSVLTHPVHPSMAPLTSSITFTCTHVARITCYRRLPLPLIFVSCSVPEFNRASFCKHTN